jgi:hypothetical protein
MFSPVSDDAQKPAVLTIGHSTRPIDEFIRMLHGHGVERLVDVHTVPGSQSAVWKRRFEVFTGDRGDRTHPHEIARAEKAGHLTPSMPDGRTLRFARRLRIKIAT